MKRKIITSTVHSIEEFLDLVFGKAEDIQEQKPNNKEVIKFTRGEYTHILELTFSKSGQLVSLDIDSDKTIKTEDRKTSRVVDQVQQQWEKETREYIENLKGELQEKVKKEEYTEAAKLKAELQHWVNQLEKRCPSVDTQATHSNITGKPLKQSPTLQGGTHYPGYLGKDLSGER